MFTSRLEDCVCGREQFGEILRSECFSVDGRAKIRCPAHQISPVSPRLPPLRRSIFVLHISLPSLLTMNVPGAVLLAPSANAKYDTMYYLKGAAAGGICCSITHGALTPVDVVKTRVQLDPVKVSKVCTSMK